MNYVQPMQVLEALEDLYAPGPNLCLPHLSGNFREVRFRILHDDPQFIFVEV